MSILIAILIFCMVVVIHEFGHFFAAKKNGVFVEEFAIGMGPVILKKQGQETLYTIRIFPIGGFCKMLGEEENVDDERSFSSKSVLQRMIIIVAGAFLNIVLAFFLFFNIFGVVGISTNEIIGFIDNSNAEAAGLVIGDRIVGVDGDKMSFQIEISESISSSLNEDIAISYERDGVIYTTSISPTIKEDGKKAIGVYMNGKEGMYRGGSSFVETARYTGGFVSFYVRYTLKSIGDIVTGNFNMDNMAGPIGIVKTVDEVYDEAMEVENISFSTKILNVTLTMINFLATISLALGIFNMLPFPALDGGRFVFLIIEGLRGKPLENNRENLIHIIGFVLLMVFAIFVAFNDVINIFS